jgi:hypothetical protein
VHTIDRRRKTGTLGITEAQGAFLALWVFFALLSQEVVHAHDRRFDQTFSGAAGKARWAVSGQRPTARPHVEMAHRLTTDEHAHLETNLLADRCHEALVV